MHDCIIVGGGIIGLSIANELLGRGLKVIVCDAPQAPTIASWAAAGILPPPIKRASHDPLEQLRELSHQLYPEWCQRLTADSGIAVEIDHCGGIYLARSVGEQISLQVAIDQWQHDGVRATQWNATELLAQEPELVTRADVTTAYYLPDEVQVRPPRILKALRHIVEQAGALVPHALDEIQIGESPDRVELQTPNGPLLARHLCVAAGPWIPRLLDPLGIRLPIEPRRGQMVLWKLDHRPFKSIINEGPRYLVARDDGHVLAGSTVEDVGFDADTTLAGIDSLRHFAAELLPRLAEVAPYRTWAGLRPMPIDGVPYLAPLPGDARVLVAAGHFRSGIHLAPASAKLIADQVTGSAPPIDISPFALQR